MLSILSFFFLAIKGFYFFINFLSVLSFINPEWKRNLSRTKVPDGMCKMGTTEEK